MQTQTSIADISDTPIRRFGFWGQVSDLGRTNFVVDQKRQSSLIPSPKDLTEEEFEISTAKIIKFPTEKVSEIVAPKKTKNFVEGVVVSYDEGSVRCNLDVSGKITSIQLPRSLFPENIRYGMPINLEMINESGFRKPLITIRKIDVKSAEKVAEEFDSIIKAL